MDDRFYSAFLPPSVVVCGRRLDRFTLWNHFVLCAIESPVGIGGSHLTIPQLLAAAKACTLVYGKPCNMRPRLADIIWRARLARSRSLLVHEASKLYKWIEECGKGPMFWRDSNGSSGNKDGGPQCLALAVSLMSRCGISREEAWNTSLGEALWMDAQAAQLEGVPIHFVGEDTLTKEFDPFNMTDEEAMAMFTRDLPAHLVQASFARWKQDKEARNA